MNNSRVSSDFKERWMGNGRRGKLSGLQGDPLRRARDQNELRFATEVNNNKRGSSLVLPRARGRTMTWLTYYEEKMEKC